MVIKKEEVKQIPILIKIISVLNYGYAAGLIILGFFLFQIMVYSALDKSSEVSILISVLPILLGLTLWFLGVFFIFIGIGLWTGKNWARISEIIIGTIFIVLFIIDIIRGDFFALFGLIIFSLIVGYLLFSKDVKQALS
jgi:uncharacterized membrane protein (DUF2068 family)